MNEKLFLYAGVSCVKHEYKVRFANDEKRIKALEKDGQTDVRLVNLPEAMTKDAAVSFIKTLDVFQDDDAQAAFHDYEAVVVREPKARVKKERAPSTSDGTYAYAGISAKNGEYKVRFAKDAMRYAALERDGQVDIRLHELPKPMNKYDAVCHIMSVEMFDDEIAQTTLDKFINGITPPERVTESVDAELEMA